MRRYTYPQHSQYDFSIFWLIVTPLHVTNSLITQGWFWPSGIVIACICLSVGVRVSMCVCVHVSTLSRTFLHHNSSSIQARITKFGLEVQNTLVKITTVLRGGWPWLSRSNWTSTSKCTPFWACTCHNSPPSIEARTTKFRQKIQNTMVKITIALGVVWPWPSGSN